MADDTEKRIADIRSAIDDNPVEAEERILAMLEELSFGDPQYPNAVLCRGLVLSKMGKHNDAGEFLMSSGVNIPEVYVNAVGAFQRCGNVHRESVAFARLAEFSPRDYETVYRRMASWATEAKAWSIAERAFYALHTLKPRDINILFQAANAASKAKKHQAAVTYYVRALDLSDHDSNKAIAHAGLGGVYKDIGEQKLSMHHFRKAAELNVEANRRSNLIMEMQYSHGVTLEDFYAECDKFSKHHLSYLSRFQFPLDHLAPEKAKTGLTIGFVSGDFVAHSLTHLILEPMRRFKAIAPQHTYICYFSRGPDDEDDWSQKYKEAVDRWYNAHAVDDLQLAKQIHADGVDVLIDIAGHTAYNRLGAFGHKPAPVQCGWVSGMMTPPGIETVHYFFTDQWLKPPSADEICREKMIELPSAYSYFPMSQMPAVGPLPADGNGYVTFGSFNNPCKISDAVLGFWGACLRQVPSSRMHIKVYGKDHERAISDKMARQGIHQSRLTFIYTLPNPADVAKYYNEKIDIVLDTFPCAGMLTSLESMWMGVPVATLIGDTFLHRQTWTVLNQIGLQDEFGSEVAEDLVRKVEAFCNNRERMREVRSTLRAKMEKADFRNPELIARKLIEGIEWAWADWCESRAPLRRLELYNEPTVAIASSSLS